jgi:peptidoglycan biosynthesis protein MviN/MurJ (putative lipid II flippase)
MFRSLVTVSILERFERGRHIEDLNQGFGFLYAANHLLTVYYVALFLPLGAEALTWVFREEYVSAYLPALFLFLSISLFGMPVGLLANVLERPQALIYSKVAILVNVFLGVPLAIRYGASGMAFAGMISAFVKNAVTYGLLRREFELRFPWSGVARFVLAGATGSAASWLAKGWMPLPAAVAVGSAAYFLGTRAFGVLNSWDRRVLVSMFPDRLQPVARLLVGT